MLRVGFGGWNLLVLPVTHTAATHELGYSARPRYLLGSLKGGFAGQGVSWRTPFSRFHCPEQQQPTPLIRRASSLPVPSRCARLRPRMFCVEGLQWPVSLRRRALRIALGNVPVYADAYAHSLPRADGKEETAVCIAATQASFGFLLLAERACDTRAAWTVDGSVRPAAGDTAGLAGFAGCRHCGTTFASRTEYILPTSTGSPGTRTASSYDVEVAAQATVA